MVSGFEVVAFPLVSSGVLFDCVDSCSLLSFLLLLPMLIYYYQNKRHAYKH